MQELIKKVIELIIPIIESVKGIDTIILSGGASLSPILYNIFENSFMKNKNLIRATYPEIAIAMGSVLFSKRHNIITPRKAKYSFGIKSSNVWDNDKHLKGGKKVYNKLDKRYECGNLFSKFITEGDNLKPDDIIEKPYILCGPKATIELYRTKEKDVMFCDEMNENGQLIVWKFGQFIIDVGKDFDSSSKKKREVIVKMKMGGTFIASTAIYSKTNKKVESKLLFE